MTGPADDLTGEEVELALNEDESLPWLESDEDDEPAGVDTARIVGFAAILLALLAGVIGGLWWFSNRETSGELLAEGSTIEAPEGPYKVKPDDAGGKEFAGTGNVAPAVGEGQTREGKLKEIVPRPEPTEAPGPSIATRTTQDKPVDLAGVGVQVGAYGSRSKADEGWATLMRQTTALEGVRHRVVKGQADIGTVYRLQAVPGDLAAARALCDKLKADGLACQVKR